MGLFFRAFLFRDAPPGTVYTILRDHYSRWPIRSEGDDERCRTDFHDVDGRWTAVRLRGFGWEPEGQSRAFRELGATGFHVFVYDGDFWGYEFYAEGRVADQFMQDPNTMSWFPGRPITGDCGVIAPELPWLDSGMLRDYLIQFPRHEEFPDYKEYVREKDRRRVRIRPGDQFVRFDQCSVVDFLRFVGLRVRCDYAGQIAFEAPILWSFWLP